MQKNLSPNPYFNKNPFIYNQRSSSLLRTNDKIYSSKNFSCSEIEKFSLEFCKLVQIYVPYFQLPYSKNLLNSVLDSLKDVFDSITKQNEDQAKEKFESWEQSLKRTAKNLAKYEELLKEKADSLEESIKNWILVKDSEQKYIEDEKNAIIKAKIEMENELKLTSEVLAQREANISAQLERVLEFENKNYQEKLIFEQLTWKLNKEKHLLREKEKILIMKEECFMKEKQELEDKRHMKSKNYDTQT